MTDKLIELTNTKGFRAVEKMIREANIPIDLRTTHSWVGWREIRTKTGLSKVPVNPHNMSWAKVNDASTWARFEKARDLYIKRKVDGIGFVFSNYDPFIGIDLDDCFFENGRMKPEAHRIVNVLDSYTELSPSKCGLHIIVKSNQKLHIPPMKKEGFEIYPTKRFFTVTSNILIGSKPDIIDRHFEVRSYIKQYVKEIHIDPFGSKKKLLPANMDECPLCLKFGRTGVHSMACPRFTEPIKKDESKQNI